MDTIAVAVLDADGNAVVSSPVVVTLDAKAQNGSVAALTGQTSATSTNGTASFIGIAVGTPGAVVLSASSAGIPPVLTNIDVKPQPIVLDSASLSLVNDSAALAAGTYIVQGAGASNIDTGEVIIGSQGEGFLRHVVSVSKTANAATLQTIPASLDEVMQNDSLIVHLSDAELSIASHGKRSHDPPVRPRFRSGGTVLLASRNGTFNIPAITLASLSGSTGFVMSAAQLTVQPSLDVSAHWGDLYTQLRDLRIAITGSATFQARTELGVSKALSQSGSIPLGTLEYPFVIPPGIPALFQIPVTIEWSVGAAGKLDVQFGWSSSIWSSVGAAWTPSTGWTPIASATASFSPQFPTPQIEASAALHVGAQLTPTLRVAGVAGGDVYAQPFFEAGAIADVINNAWSTSCRSAVSTGLDFRLSILGHTLGAYSTSTELAATSWPVCAKSGTLLPVNVTISPTSATIEPGDVLTLIVTVTNSKDHNVTWSSSNPSVASVDEQSDGTAAVHAVSAGTTQITATHASGAQATVSITVSVAQSGIASIRIQSINTAAGLPANLQLLQGVITITALANPAGQQVSEIDVTLNGQVASRQTFTATPGTVTLALDTSKFPNGSYQLQVLMFVAGNASPVRSAAVSVGIGN